MKVGCWQGSEDKGCKGYKFTAHKKCQKLVQSSHMFRVYLTRALPNSCQLFLSQVCAITSQGTPPVNLRSQNRNPKNKTAKNRFRRHFFRSCRPALAKKRDELCWINREHEKYEEIYIQWRENLSQPSKLGLEVLCVLTVSLGFPAEALTKE